MNYVLWFALGVGFTAGLRSLTPPAVVAWAAHLGWLNLNNSPLAFMGSIIAAIIFSLLALFELFADLQPSTQKRTAPVPLIARIVTGGLCGVCICAAGNQSLIIGALLGGIGGVIAAFAGYESARSRVDRMQSHLLPQAARARDLVKLQYEKGAASLFEFLDAQRTYLATQSEFLQNLNDFWTAVFQMEQASGMELHR